MVKKVTLNETIMGGFARHLIQQAMKEKGWGYRELAEALQIKFKEEANEKVVGTKVGRATFSAAFFLMAMAALDCTSVEITMSDIEFFYRNARPDGRFDWNPPD